LGVLVGRGVAVGRSVFVGVAVTVAVPVAVGWGVLVRVAAGCVVAQASDISVRMSTNEKKGLRSLGCIYPPGYV